MKNKVLSSLLAFGVLTPILAIGDGQAIQIDEMVLVASSFSTMDNKNLPMGQTGEEPSLLPEDTEIASEEVFGTQGGYFHPYLNVYGEWTDNLYNTNTDEVDNFLTRISPGVWFALPRKKVIPITITPHNTSPGGLQNQLREGDYTDRFMSYALIGADFKMYSEDSDLNDTDVVGEGLLRYNLRGGLSLQVVDRYTMAEDTFGFETIVRGADNRARFDSNLFMATADWEMTEKLRLKLDYTNFFLEYDEDIDDFQNRTDNGIDLYGYYIYSEKTSFFLQYKFIDAAYDVATESDSEQNFYYGGINWNTTEKLALLFKAGYQEREFDAADKDGYDGLALDFQAKYLYSEKTDLNFSLYRTNEESDSLLASDRTVWGAKLFYNQKFTEKITGSIDLRYENADYRLLTGEESDETTIIFRPALQYLFKEWLRAEAAYKYEEKDSPIDINEYKTNIFMIGLNLAI